MSNDLQEINISIAEIKKEIKVAFKLLNSLSEDVKVMKDNHLSHMSKDIQELQTKMQFIGFIAIGSFGLGGTL